MYLGKFGYEKFCLFILVIDKLDMMKIHGNY